MIPPNIRQSQFIVCAFGLFAVGKNTNTNIGTKNTIAVALIQIPAFPSDHLDGGSGSPLSRFHSKHPMLRIYEPTSAEMVSETIALSATLDPRLTREMTTPQMKETMIAFSGMGWLGRTVLRNLEKGKPLSRLKAQIWRLAVAISAITAQMRMMMMMAAKKLVAVYDFVVSRKYGSIGNVPPPSKSLDGSWRVNMIVKMAM